VLTVGIRGEFMALSPPAKSSEIGGSLADTATPTEHPSGRHESIASLVGRVVARLSAKTHRRLAYASVLMVVSALVEAISYAALIPFLTAMVAPEQAARFPMISALAHVVGFNDPLSLRWPLALGFCLATIVSLSIRMVTIWYGDRLAAAIVSELSLAAYQRTLEQSYMTHVTRNSSGIRASLLSYVPALTANVVFPAMRLLTLSLVVFVLAVTLLMLQPGIATILIGLLAVAYSITSAVTRPLLLYNGQLQAEHARHLYQAVDEGLGSIRDMIIDHSQSYYVERYREHETPLRRLVAEANTLAHLPRFVVEGIAMIGIVALAYSLVSQPQGLTTAVPTLGLLTLAAQRLLPAIHECFFSIAQMRNASAIVDSVLALADQPAPLQQPALTALPFHQSLSLANVSFRYSSDADWVLRNVNVTIAKGDRIAIVGATGSGKSTLADIIMGLLEPSEGSLLIDGQPLTAAVWQAAIAHVPQALFLADASVAANIAIGVPIERIDAAQLHDAATQAHIDDFVNSLPRGYDTPVGERGIRLSGGQKQRIGIARALYKNAAVLVLDEATNALDEDTEKSLVTTLAGLPRSMTIIMITHRAVTTQYFNRVIEVTQGGVTERLHHNSQAAST